MNTTRFVNAVVVALFASGCATTTLTPANAVQCAASCQLEVSVVDDGAGGKRLRITDDGNVQMRKTFRQAVVIWRLQTDGYKFENDSVRPHTGAPIGSKSTTTQDVWNSQITNAHAGGPKNYILVNANDRAVTLFYDIKVFSTTGGPPVSMDPAIMNDP